MKPSRKPTPAYGLEKVKDVVSPAPEQRTFDDAIEYDTAFFEKGLIKTSKDWEAEVEAQVAEVAKIREGSKSKALKMVDKSEAKESVSKIDHEVVVFRKIKKGDNWEQIVIRGNELQVGVFANANIPEKVLTGHREISAPRVDFRKDQVVVKILDGIQNDDEDLKTFKKALSESNRTKSYDPIRKTDVCMSEMQVTIDLAKNSLKASVGTSEGLGYLGNKCFVMRGNTIFECSNVDIQKELYSGDVIFVASNNILNRLMEENIGVNSKAATQEYRDATLISEIRTILSGAVDEAGKLNQERLFNKLSDMYFESRVKGQNGTVASTFVAYQMP